MLYSCINMATVGVKGLNCITSAHLVKHFDNNRTTDWRLVCVQVQLVFIATGKAVRLSYLSVDWLSIVMRNITYSFNSGCHTQLELRPRILSCSDTSSCVSPPLVSHLKNMMYLRLCRCVTADRSYLLTMCMHEEYAAQLTATCSRRRGATVGNYLPYLVGLRKRDLSQKFQINEVSRKDTLGGCNIVELVT